LNLVRENCVILHHTQANFRCSEVFTLSLDHTVANDENDLVAVWVICGSDGVESCTQAFRTLGICGDQADGVSQRVPKRLPLRRGLRNNSFVDEARRAGTLFADDTRIAVLS
jgi:hypothetical protein